MASESLRYNDFGIAPHLTCRKASGGVIHFWGIPLACPKNLPTVLGCRAAPLPTKARAPLPPRLH